MRRNSVLLMFSFIVTLLLSAFMVNGGEASQITVIRVNPTTNVASIGETFTVNINIMDIDDLYSWELRLKWNGPILNVTEVVEGDFLSSAGIRDTFFTPKIYNAPDPKGVSDYVYITCTLLGRVPGEFGSGTLVTITFLVEAEGESVLDIYDVELSDSLFPVTPPIEHTVEDGYFNVAPPSFHVEPETIVNSSLTSGESFFINVSISDVVDLYGLSFSMRYDTALLNATDVAVVPFLNEPVSVDSGIDSETRIVRVSVNSTAAEPVSGSGVLARVTFQVIGAEPGECVLDVCDTWVNDTLARLKDPPFEHSPPAVDGYFSNTEYHDVAVTAVTAFPVEVKVGESVSINVTVRNWGDFNETFDVVVYYDGNIVDTQTDIILEAGDKRTLTFSWDTTDIAAKAYAIKAEASVVEGEADVGNNKRTFSPVTVQSPAPSILPYVLVGVVVVVVIVVLVYFLWFRKGKSK